ncbi:MAG TPA: hypothetical protein VF808_20015 [Ktedonobacterales bacterium]
MLNVRGLGFEQAPASSFGVPTPIVYERVTEPQRWEYHTVTIDLHDDEPLDARALNALGAEGWMLLSVVQTAKRGEGASLTYYFMRYA